MAVTLPENRPACWCTKALRGCLPLECGGFMMPYLPCGASQTRRSAPGGRLRGRQEGWGQMTVREPTYKPAVNWKTCSRSSTCIGVAIHDGGPCLAHAEESSVTSAITQLKETGAIDGRGVRFSGPLLQRLLASLPRDIGRRWLGQALFDQATFTGEANFDGIAFRGDARFYYATFERRAGFQDARFEADAWFEGARFRARTVFMVAN